MRNKQLLNYINKSYDFEKIQSFSMIMIKTNISKEISIWSLFNKL